MPEITQFNFPTIIRYGQGAIRELGSEINKRNFKKPFLVTDRDISKLEIFQVLLHELKKENVHPSIYSGTHGNPLVSHVEEGKKSYVETNSDCIIAFGGGAAIDVAKCIAVISSHDGKLLEYEDRPGMKEIDTVRLPFIFAIPTTAGTGSEVGRSGVVSDDTTKIKKIIFSPGLLPGVVFLDPDMTLRLPPGVTASTGIDALTHLIEAYLAKGFHPLCDGIALEGIALVSKSLEACFHFAKSNTGSTKEHILARSHMLLASSMGAIAFQKGLGVNHSCAHALSTVSDLHHGLANGIMLSYCMKFNSREVPEKFKRMAEVIGLSNPSVDSFLDWLNSLLKKLEIPEKLSLLGVKSDDISRLVSIAYEDVCHRLNPRKVSENDFKVLFEEAVG